MSGPWDGLGFPVVGLPSSASSPDAVVRFLLEQLVQAGRLRPEDAATIASQVLHRETLASTGIGRGIALPHGKSDLVGELLGVVGRSTTGVAWPGALDDAPVRVVCLLVAPASRPGDYLRALAAIKRRLQGEGGGA
jgi:mannitol/fructose-specific phosphotransferase system IIA component (Ntr-type)